MHFLSFFNFAFSPCQGTWLQGYKGRMHSPLVPVHVPMDLQGHFLNILLSEKENILSLALSLIFPGLSLELKKRMVVSFLRDILGFVLVLIDTLGTQGHSRFCPWKAGTFPRDIFGFVHRVCPCPYFVPGYSLGEI
nr:MAG TPA: hypothetical protein [Caudoviricetes sp.]